MPEVTDNMGTLRDRRFAATVAVTGGSCPQLDGTVLVASQSARCMPTYYLYRTLPVPASGAFVGFVNALYGFSKRGFTRAAPFQSFQTDYYSSELLTLSLADTYGFGGDWDNPRLVAQLRLVHPLAGVGFPSYSGRAAPPFLCLGASNTGNFSFSYAYPTSYSASPSLLAIWDFTVWALYDLGDPAFDPAFPSAGNPCPYVTIGPAIVTDEGYKYRKTDLALRVTVTEAESSASAAPSFSGLPTGFTTTLAGFADARPQCQYVTEWCAIAGTGVPLTGTAPGFKEYWSGVGSMNGTYSLYPWLGMDLPFGVPQPVPFPQLWRNMASVGGVLVPNKIVSVPGCVRPVVCPFGDQLVTPDPLQFVVFLVLDLWDSLTVRTVFPWGGVVDPVNFFFGGSVGNIFVYSRATTALWPKTGPVTLNFDAARSDPVYPGVSVPSSITLTPTGFTP
jgi:hypothetical protein